MEINTKAGVIGCDIPGILHTYPFIIQNLEETLPLASYFRFIDSLDVLFVIHNEQEKGSNNRRLERIIRYGLYHRIRIIALTFMPSIVKDSKNNLKIQKTPFSSFKIPEIILSRNLMEQISPNDPFLLLYSGISSIFHVFLSKTKHTIESERLWSSEVQIFGVYLNRNNELFRLSDIDFSSPQHIAISMLYSGKETLEECEKKVMIIAKTFPSSPITWGAAIQNDTTDITLFGWYCYRHRLE